MTTVSRKRIYKSMLMFKNPTIPDKIPGKIDIWSDSGRIQFFRESWGWADWRIGLTDNEWGWITTEFACHWCRSPNTVHAISFWLRTLDEPVDIIEPIGDILSATRLSDQDFIHVTIELVREKVSVTLWTKKRIEWSGWLQNRGICRCRQRSTYFFPKSYRCNRTG